MRYLMRSAAWAGIALGLALGQHADNDVKLPNGKWQKEEMLKADHQKNLQDAAALVEMAEQLKRDLERNDRYVLSVSTLKRTEEIEKIAKRIRGRLRRF
jgi:hypothetical protein